MGQSLTNGEYDRIVVAGTKWWGNSAIRNTKSILYKNKIEEIIITSRLFNNLIKAIISEKVEEQAAPKIIWKIVIRPVNTRSIKITSDYKKIIIITNRT